MGGGVRLRFDPHVHTGASYDARGSVDAVLARCRDQGLDAVAITDHDTAVAARRAVIRQDRYGVLVVPGVEISTADGHLLALGVSTDPPTGCPFARTVEWVRDRGGLAVVPHPFQRSRHGVEGGALTDCDGIETFNAWAVTGVQNRRAAVLARQRDYPALGGSDAHHPSAVGTAYTEVRTADETVDAVLDAVAAGRCQAVGSSYPLRASLRKYAAAVGRWVRSDDGAPGPSQAHSPGT